MVSVSGFQGFGIMGLGFRVLGVIVSASRIFRNYFGYMLRISGGGGGGGGGGEG